MANITGIGAPPAPAAAAAAPRPGVSSFAVPAEPSPAPSALATPRAIAGVASLDAMLALQEQMAPGNEASVRDRDARRRGQGLLAALAALQHALLSGAEPDDALAQLAALADGPPAATPQLEDALRSLSLRAQIELARRQPGKHGP